MAGAFLSLQGFYLWSTENITFSKGSNFCLFFFAAMFSIRWAARRWSGRGQFQRPQPQLPVPLLLCEAHDSSEILTDTQQIWSCIRDFPPFTWDLWKLQRLFTYYSPTWYFAALLCWHGQFSFLYQCQGQVWWGTRSWKRTGLQLNSDSLDEKMASAIRPAFPNCCPCDEELGRSRIPICLKRTTLQVMRVTGVWIKVIGSQDWHIEHSLFQVSGGSPEARCRTKSLGTSEASSFDLLTVLVREFLELKLRWYAIQQPFSFRQ